MLRVTWCRGHFVPFILKCIVLKLPTHRWNLLGLEVTFQIFLQWRQQTISTAALLSGRGLERQRGSIAPPVHINRPPLNNQKEKIPGNGKNLATDLLSRNGEPMGSQ